uniref:J domain-containing protein n=1 Tax=Spongospora subterranea TaxID=70186 RepID=A0A0H5R8E1_9EUKA|eukprot:CRZ10086.1 hypothetical protein [Spongospora subterranea]
MSNAYTLLGLAVDASDQQIRTAYRQTALKFHPDKCKEDPNANERFAEVVAAFELLKDAVRRGELDAKLKAMSERQERLKRQSLGKQIMIEKLERREKEHEERQRQRDSEVSAESIRQKIQSELIRIRQEIISEEARKVQQASTKPSAPVNLSNTISIRISRKRKPAPNDDELRQLFSRYGHVIDVVQSNKRRALISFIEETGALSATSQSERDFLSGMGFTASLYGSAMDAKTDAVEDNAGPCSESQYPSGPYTSPLASSNYPSLNDMSFDDLEKVVMERMQQMADKQALVRAAPVILE